MADQRLRRDTLTPTMGSAREFALDAKAATNSARDNHAHSGRETPPTTTSPHLSVKKRKHSKPKVGKSSLRYMYTPQTQGSSMSGSDIDKKRNKLGYQRISIACAHCRRRKIRCVADENDPQQRCQNCLRLKKECLYYAVEQQDATEDVSQSFSKAGRSSTVSSSPAEIGSGRPFGEREGCGDWPILPSNASTSYPGSTLMFNNATYSQGTSIFVEPTRARHTNDATASLPESDYDDREESESDSPWIPSEEFDPRLNTARTLSTSYPNQHQWQVYQSGGTGDFAPFPVDAMQQPHNLQNAPAFTYTRQNVHPNWPQAFEPAPHTHMTRSVHHSGPNYADGYRPSTVDRTTSPYQIQSASTAQQESTSQMARVEHLQPPFPPHPYTNSPVAYQSYSNEWLPYSSSYEPQHGEHMQNPPDQYMKFHGRYP